VKLKTTNYLNVQAGSRRGWQRAMNAVYIWVEVIPGHHSSKPAVTD